MEIQLQLYFTKYFDLSGDGHYSLGKEGDNLKEWAKEKESEEKPWKSEGRIQGKGGDKEERRIPLTLSLKLYLLFWFWCSLRPAKSKTKVKNPKELHE